MGCGALALAARVWGVARQLAAPGNRQRPEMTPTARVRTWTSPLAAAVCNWPAGRRRRVSANGRRRSGGRDRVTRAVRLPEARGGGHAQVGGVGVVGGQGVAGRIPRGCGDSAVGRRDWRSPADGARGSSRRLPRAVPPEPVIPFATSRPLTKSCGGLRRVRLPQARARGGTTPPGTLAFCGDRINK